MSEMNIAELVEKSEKWFQEEELELLYELAQKCLGEGVILEIGCFDGISTAVLAKGSKEGRKIKVYTIDPYDLERQYQDWFGNKWHYQEFKTTLSALGVTDVVFPFFRKPETVVKTFDKQIELFFINEYLNIQNINHFLPGWVDKIVDGGLIVTYSFDAIESITINKKTFEKQYTVGNLTVYKKVKSVSISEKLTTLVK